MRRHRTALLAAILGLLVAAAVATAAVSGGGATPAHKALPVAVHDALTAPAVPGVTARIRFTNNLVPTDVLPHGAATPLLTGATGRAWVAQDGRFRLELQSEEGDAEVVSDGKTVTVYDAKSNTLYTAALPRERRHARDHAGRHAGLPSLARVRAGLAKLARHLTLSGAQPTNVAGQPAYELTVSPRRHGGLVGAASLAWDAARGVPLRIALTPRGSTQPVLALEATDISYGTVPSADLVAPSPPGAKHRTVDVGGRHHAGGHGERHARVPAGVAAPARLAGRARAEVRGVGDHGALVLYGEGLDGIAVLQSPAKGANRSVDELPRVAVGGATGHELATPLGTVITWTRGGTRFTLVASQPKALVEAAARALR